MIEEEDNEAFYVYRSLHSDESWGAIPFSSNVNKLPNISFGMKILAKNERSAISRARNIYDEKHNNANRNKLFEQVVLSCVAPWMDRALEFGGFDMKTLQTEIINFSKSLLEKIEAEEKNGQD